MPLEPPIGFFYCNREHKAAYLSIRKCGCSSIATYIAQHTTEKVLEPIWKPEHLEVNFDLVTSDEQALEQYFTFTFVRNPYDRFLSFYRNWIVDPYHREVIRHYEKFGLYENMPFDACVKAFVKIPALELEPHAVPMHFFVFRGKKSRVKFLGKLENIDTDFGYVKRACSLKGELPLLNPTGLSKKPDPYTPELRSLIYNFYRRDFEVFGYDKRDARAAGWPQVFFRRCLRTLRRRPAGRT